MVENDIFSRVLGILQDFIDLPNILKEDEQEFLEKFNIKINQGKQANQQFIIHLHGRSIQDILEQIKQELLKQLEEYSLIFNVLNLEETSSQKNSLKELENYCSDVVKNSEIWNIFITGGYQQWFNNKLKKDHTPQDDQNEKIPKGE